MPVLRRRAFSLVEVLVGIGLLVALIAAAVWLFSFANRSTARLAGQMAVQQASRKALVRLIRELQEGMEVMRPAPGATLSYALVRDSVSRVVWYFQEPQPGAPGLFVLKRFREGQTEVLLTHLKRLTFTSRSEGAVSMNVELAEEDRSYALLTTVRSRNLASAEQLW